MAFTNIIISLLGAVASIVTTGQKRPGPTQQNNTRPSKKPRQIKKEVIKQEIPRVQLPVTKIDTGEIIVIDSDSDQEDNIYVPKPVIAVCFQSSESF